MLEQSDSQRRQAEALILARLADLVQADPRGTALSMATASLALLASVFPAGLTIQDQQRILDNLPGTDPARIADHAMSPEGTRVAVLLGNYLMRCAIDHSPLSFATTEQVQDEAVTEHAHYRAAGAINHGFEAALAEGFSGLGVVSMSINAVVTRASELGLHPFQVVRPLQKGVARTLQRIAPRDQDDSEEAAVTALAQQLGISRSKAREHLRQGRGG
ncbi:hypothetical protein [Ramlibacter sp.]|uniref:hypothetical protein n=1 Tax=Ramlibacter sp. TaxID=1917967 RepID=UPI002D461DF2|nr:hypothetical protein [Ramlibacter sp.]HYD77159.1 hypothetical protein [Ramlibacter sp.]